MDYGAFPFFFPLRFSDSCFFNCLNGAFSDQAVCVAVVISSLSGDGCMPLSCVSWEVLVCVRFRCAVTRTQVRDARCFFSVVE